ncbi:MAG: methyltransferase domain-containing protein, partial [Pseudomonadales bacterium]|nr:methyltransferase domain-containing protein [Pseudomonadales bacterium]
RRHLPASCKVIGIDNSEAMVERCRTNVARDRSQAAIEIRHESMLDTAFSNASVVVMNFTLQFIADADREPLLRRIAEGLLPGGILILSEKVEFADPEMQSTMTTIHHDFKRYQGYSDLEISQKRAALENVLIPNTEDLHIRRLQDAGFSKVFPYMRCLNFESILAIR